MIYVDFLKDWNRAQKFESIIELLIILVLIDYSHKVVFVDVQ